MYLLLLIINMRLSGTSLYSFAFPSRFVSRSSITLINCAAKGDTFSFCLLLLFGLESS
ncbi:hypothetical protein GLYMA_15G250750v4 [Glycine max]|nr:hypothetical protein GLYMA_15G250750v4 [Glycine max]KAH1148762.1 hypothetical protein GYH30_043403 [Glycine max]